MDEYVKCKDGLECIGEEYMCDGETTCNDNSDESPELCQGYILLFLTNKITNCKLNVKVKSETKSIKESLNTAFKIEEDIT